MSIKIKSKVLKASEYTHSLILFSDKFLENENFTSKIILRNEYIQKLLKL